MYKKILLTLACSSLFFGLAACGSNEQTNNSVQTKEKEPSPQDTAKEKKKESTTGNRSNPINFNETATVNDVIFNSEDGKFEKFKAKVELSILEVIRGNQAFEILKNENQFNEAAPEGKEWALVKIKGKVTDAETQDHEYDLFGSNFKIVSNDGHVYNNEQYAVTPNELHQKLYKGAEGEGYISQLVNTGDDFKIQFETHESKKVFFNSK
ncbi:hypothetical protein FT637_25365 [Bacillus cereus]|uniref:hypothetical protein n=1 Tax=Bacillus cereus TaxID=1396 RepID=UPI0018795AEC|nr:hypothetical protein [Bacillus cereus]MBE7106218.1 hypothetical protein [Bacillus cereus]MBE7122646.1 hypothetical protein [Bacillus cereus]